MQACVCVFVHTRMPMLAHVYAWDVSLCVLCVLIELTHVFHILCVRHWSCPQMPARRKDRAELVVAVCSDLRGHRHILSCCSGERNYWGKWGHSKVQETKKLKTTSIPT